MTALFDEIQFDPKISYGATGGPMYRTTVIIADSGAENRIGWWLSGRRKWNISTGVKSAAQMIAINAFHMLRKGRLRGFRYKDWTDYKANREHFWNGFGAGPVRLIKTYADGSGQTEQRTIWKPVNGTVSIYTTPTGGSAVSPGSYSIDYTTGIVTGLAGATDYYWTGEFDVPVRFDQDEININLEFFNTQQWDSITVIELLLR